MKAKYQHISFIQIDSKTKTTVWSCVNNRNQGELGVVKWYPAWRQYCYFPKTSAVYSKDCLDDIGDFIQQLESFQKYTFKPSGER